MTKGIISVVNKSDYELYGDAFIPIREEEKKDWAVEWLEDMLNRMSLQRRKRYYLCG